eukprot:Amastigsp_a429_239.p4 type:complete len:121 gc:universal Amastigsp_a429_239:714-1076(+)
MPTGHEAPWRGSRMTRTSWQKYLPPNWAPMPAFCVALWTAASISRSRNACPCSLPRVGRLSRYLVVASLTVFRVCSAESPPMTMARWYGGHAEVPSEVNACSRNGSRVFGFRSALVCWYR